MKIYLAGPMRGIKDLNFPAFDRATQWLREHGYTVFNPAENDREKGYDKLTGIDIRRRYITDDLLYIINEAEAVVLLPNWDQSHGVAAEIATAEFLDLPVWEFEKMKFYSSAYEIGNARTE